MIATNMCSNFGGFRCRPPNVNFNGAVDLPMFPLVWDPFLSPKSVSHLSLDSWLF